ncbi:MAG: YdeI/OmpD-associated family protein [Myxococcota bacterium]
MATKKTDTLILGFHSKRAWAAWLAKNHQASSGLWLQLARTSSAEKSVTYAEALEVALSYGWIDGQKKSHDEATWLQKFTPRGPRSIWSKVNREKALALIASGDMEPAGLAAVEKAKADGRWDAAYDSPRSAAVPEDLRAAFDENSKAKAFFATLNSRNRYAILYRIQTAKKAETRAKRIAEFVAMLARGEKLHP